MVATYDDCTGIFLNDRWGFGQILIGYIYGVLSVKIGTVNKKVVNHMGDNPLVKIVIRILYDTHRYFCHCVSKSLRSLPQMKNLMPAYTFIMVYHYVIALMATSHLERYRPPFWITLPDQIDIIKDILVKSHLAL